MMDEGVCGTLEELANREKGNSGYMSRMLRLTLLAPELVEAILDGRQPAKRYLTIRGAVLSDLGDRVLVVGNWWSSQASHEAGQSPGALLAQGRPPGAGTDHSPRPFSPAERGPVRTDAEKPSMWRIKKCSSAF